MPCWPSEIAGEGVNSRKRISFSFRSVPTTRAYWVDRVQGVGMLVCIRELKLLLSSQANRTGRFSRLVQLFQLVTRRSTCRCRSGFQGLLTALRLLTPRRTHNSKTNRDNLLDSNFIALLRLDNEKHVTFTTYFQCSAPASRFLGGAVYTIVARTPFFACFLYPEISSVTKIK